MAPEILHRVCYGRNQVGRDPAATKLAAGLSIRPAILHGYCRHRVKLCDYPGIIAEHGHTVRGTYVVGLTDGDIFRLDQFEGDEYERRKVKVEVLHDGNHGSSEGKGDEGRDMDAETYVYTAGDNNLEKREWDYDEFRKQKLHRWADESYEYQGELGYRCKRSRMSANLY